jgi:hypothetical protein
MQHDSEGETVLSGMLEQVSLQGVLMSIRDLGLKRITVNRIGPMGAT